jgi:hypothetical protein
MRELEKERQVLALQQVEVQRVLHVNRSCTLVLRHFQFVCLPSSLFEPPLPPALDCLTRSVVGSELRAGFSNALTFSENLDACTVQLESEIQAWIAATSIYSPSAILSCSLSCKPTPGRRAAGGLAPALPTRYQVSNIP